MFGCLQVDPQLLTNQPTPGRGKKPPLQLIAGQELEHLHFRTCCCLLPATGPGALVALALQFGAPRVWIRTFACC